MIFINLRKLFCILCVVFFLSLFLDSKVFAANCGPATCADGTTGDAGDLLCTPSCSAANKTCWTTGTCTAPSDCNVDGCPSNAQCVQDNCGTVVCQSGGNCVSDCSACGGNAPGGGYTPDCTANTWYSSRCQECNSVGQFYGSEGTDWGPISGAYPGGPWCVCEERFGS